MREMKVRVWDDVLKEMLYSRVEQFDDMLGFRFEKHLETENPIYMWSTGLRDKNGKEIYEGDILECFTSGPSVIEFNGGLFGLKNKVEGFVPFNYLYGDVEVLGNIYENPELLEAGT